ncbi:MAG: hypothetical protein KC657_03205 [Myxococcales bacterium]|nr:hypothetical protein [Myxococcales bacterium]
MAAFHSLVEPLEAAWRAVLDDVLARRGGATTGDVRALAAAVAQMSDVYNAQGHSRGVALAARVGFGLPRDVPKSAGAVRELLGAGLVAGDGAALRVVDLGAGVGATTLGVVRALRKAGVRRPVEATLIDTDADALGAFRDVLASARAAEIPCVAGLDVETVPGPVTPALPHDADLVLLGQVLSELDPGLSPADRAARHAELLRALARGLRPGGAIVVVEPALRDRTRHLHAVRDALTVDGGPLSVFAPCLHRGRCPALAHEGDWCHEDLAIDLPDWLVPVARAAGLRFQGLTFSYLVLRADGRSVGELFEDPAGAVRVISEAIRTKGKREAWVCGPGPAGEGSRTRLRLLDRDATDAHAAWEELRRGDLLRLEGSGDEPAVDDRGRIGRRTRVARVGR